MILRKHAQHFFVLALLLCTAVGSRAEAGFWEQLFKKFKDYGVTRAQTQCEPKLGASKIVLNGNDFLEEYENINQSAKDYLREKGPFGSTLAVGCEVVSKNKVLPRIYGIENAVKNAPLSVFALQKLVDTIGLKYAPELKTSYTSDWWSVNKFEHNFLTTIALGGSTIRTENFNDVDLEMSLVYRFNYMDESQNVDSTAARLMKQGASNFNQAIESFLVDHIDYLTQQGFIFSELKAGEYDQSLPVGKYHGEKGKGIKWTYSELKAGKKIILDSYGASHEVKIRDAIAQEARIKLDLLLTVPVFPRFAKSGLTEHVMEVTVVYFLGYQYKENTPVLKLGQFEHFPEIGASGGHVIEKDKASTLPLRSTVLYFHPEDMKLARDLSMSAPSPDGYLLNIMSLAHIQKMLDHDESYKAIKRIYNRFKYWNDSANFLDAYNTKNSRSFKTIDMLSGLKEIIDDKDIVLAERLRVDFENISKSALLQNRDRFIRMQKVLKKYYPYSLGKAEIPIETSWEGQSIAIKKWIDKAVKEKIHKNILIQAYIQYLKEIKYTNELVARGNSKVFISFQLKDEFKQGLVNSLIKVKGIEVAGLDQAYETYTDYKFNFPLIDFLNQSDLHMTLSYLGEFPESRREEINHLMKEFYKEIGTIKLIHPSLKIMGKDGSLIAVQFDPNSLSDEQKRKVFKFKSKLEELGLKPDRFIESFLPHVTIAKIDRALKSKVGTAQVNEFLRRYTIKEESTFILDGTLELLESIEGLESNDTDYYRLFDIESD